MELAEFRRQFPITRTRAYLFSGALAPAAAPVRAAWDDWSSSWSTDPNHIYTVEMMIGAMDELRGSFARLIGAPPESVAITDSTSRAANIAVRILAARRPGGNVVIDDGTYPSSAYPWQAAGGHEIRFVPTDDSPDPAAALAERIDERTAAVCICHVAPFTGRRHDLRAVADGAHAHDAPVLVDAAQSAGAVPIDVAADGVDALVTTAMKWLLGPPGIGLLYLSPELLANAPVLDVGYLGLDAQLGEWPPQEMPPVHPDARRYELGLPSLPGVLAARAGVDLLLDLGMEAVHARVQALATRCIDGLAEQGADIVTPVDTAARAGVIAVRHPDPGAVFAECRRCGVDIGAIGCIRVDPHAFNDESDVDRFLEVYARVGVPAGAT